MHRLIIWFLTTICSLELQAQNAFPFFDQLVGDSVAIYFNNEYMVTEKSCADYIRLTRVSEKGDFNGSFEDYSVHGLLRAKGVYRMGAKHGYFELYHSNGKLWGKGYYENNIPVGVWEFFYESGFREKTFDFRDGEALLMNFIDKAGDEKIKDGKGTFEGYDLIKTDQVYNVRIKGEILDGLPVGKWKAFNLTDGAAVYAETFDHGRLVNTSTLTKNQINAKTPPKLTALFRIDYLSYLEGFHFQSCNQSSTFYTGDPDFNLQIIKLDLSSKITELIEYDIQQRKTEGYTYGDNVLTVQFYIDKNGIVNDVRQTSLWGERFYPTVKNVISKSAFYRTDKTLYFSMRLSYAGGRRYRYELKFSSKKD